jgi:5-methyltetrahydropteroyltriglutamate--homocysteine methyltransferase
MIKTTVVGSYPKPPREDKPGARTPFELRRVLRSLEKGDASVDDLHAAQDRLVAEVIFEQEEAGVDVVTDGHVRWDDLVTPFAGHMAGIELSGLLRYFDNNVYYRRPVCVGPVEWRGPVSVDAWRFADSVATKPVKAVVPGPLTIARLSLDDHYSSHDKFVLAVARVLAQEAFELEAAGARIIQIDEPALLDAPEDLPLAKTALDIVVAELKLPQIVLATYFSEAKRLGAELFDMPAHVFHLDLVSAPENAELIPLMPPESRLQAGVVDSRNTLLESTSDVAAVVHGLFETMGPDRLSLAPSAGLEFLPRDKARAKLERLTQIARKAGA